MAKQLQQLTGTGIATGYTASTAFQPGRSKRVRFWVRTVVAGGSSLTTITVKLQQRYNDGTTTLGYIDLPSHLDDVVGSAQPKGSTLEIEHAFTVSAPGTFDNTFVLDVPEALHDVTTNVKGNAAGGVGDSVTVYAELA